MAHTSMKWWFVVAMALVACGDDGPPTQGRPVAIRASGCALTDEVASGIVVAEGLVLTVGHVLRNAVRVSVDGREGAVIAIDHRLDAALITVASDEPVVALATEVGLGPATVDGQPVFVRQVVTADVEEPRDATRYLRRVLVVDAELGRGDSGAGVLAPDGSLLGMVFASSRRDPGVAYAVSAEELTPFIIAASETTGPITLSCR